MTALALNKGNVGVVTLFNEDHYTATTVINPRVDSITVVNPTAVTIVVKIDCPLAYLETARTYTSTTTGTVTGNTASGSGAILDTAVSLAAGARVVYATSSTYDTTPQNYQNDSIPFASTTPIVAVTEVTQDSTTVVDPDILEYPLRPVLLGTAANTAKLPFFAQRTANVYQLLAGLTARLTDADVQRVIDWEEMGGTLKDLIDSSGGSMRLRYNTTLPVLDANAYPAGQSVLFEGGQWHTGGRLYLPYGQNDPSYTSRYFTDFYNTDLTATVSGTGAARAVVAGTASHPGVNSISAGTTTTGYAHVGTDINAMVLAGGQVIFETIVNPTLLSTSGEEFILRAGLFDNNTAVTPVNGVYFTYDRLTSAKWYINTAIGSTRTSTATTIADLVAATWYKLTIIINPLSTSATFYVNDVSVGTVTTNFPTVALGAGVHIIKSAGTTARLVSVDSLLLAQGFATAR